MCGTTKVGKRSGSVFLLRDSEALATRSLSEQPGFRTKKIPRVCPRESTYTNRGVFYRCYPPDKPLVKGSKVNSM